MGGYFMSNRRKFIQQIALGSAGIVVAQYPWDLYANDDFVRISILHTNDMHCHIDPFPESDARNGGKGGMARLLSMIDHVREENPNTFLFDAGDMFQGTPYFNYYKGELMMKVMSRMAYDAGTIGNHEFDNGLEGLKNALPFAGFPILSSNYDFSETILNGAFRSCKTFEKGGIKVGVYALGVELDGLVSKKNYQETKYLDPVKKAIEMELFLKKEKHCDLVVCLSHLGFKYQEEKVSDQDIARETSYTDLIIGGHTHTFLNDAVRLENKKNNEVIVNQVGFGALVMGQVDFVFDKSRKIRMSVSSLRKNE